MIRELAEIFFNVITPVFALVLLGYLAGPRLQLEARTLSRFAYYLLVPAFVFTVISTAALDPRVVLQMLLFITAVQVGCMMLGWLVPRLLGRSPQMASAYILIAVFGNVGNFGFPLIEFRLGPDALVAATVYFLVILVSGFVLGVAAASWHQGGSWRAVLEVLKTPALLAFVPAFLLNWLDWQTPLFLGRAIGLLGNAMVPTMLVALGVQLAATERLAITADVWIASAVRLIGGPALALLLVGWFGVTGIERGAGIFQSAMPAAVLTSIIALEYDLLPDFVTTTVLFSTLASVVTLTLLFAFV